MPRTELTPKSRSDIDHRKAILSLRWLLVILASYLTLFSYVGTELFPFVFGFALAFSASNFALMLIPRTQFLTRRARALISVLDFFFVSATLYLLRVPGDYLYVTFAAIFILALIWRDLRLVLFSLFVVSLLFGVFSYFRLFGFQFDTDIERFLTLALFFVVAIFYVFLSERLTEDATISRTMTEENRIAEVMVVPMIVAESVLGLIYVRSPKLGSILPHANIRFFEVMAGTAANALRNAQLFEEVEHRARTDFLTGLPNHRFFQTILTMELARAERHHHPLSLLMIDLDFLKQVNDRFGHPSGDLVIRTLAGTIRTSCREIDFAARYGGEEFTVILPETPLAGAIHVAERIRERIWAENFPGIGTITASVGISNYPVNALNKEDLIRVADQALYVAKNDGRNRVAYFNYQMITK